MDIYDFELLVINILDEEFDLDPAILSATSNLRKDCGLDDVEVLEFLQKVEQSFRISIPPMEEADMQTVGDVAAFIQRHQSESD